MVMPPKKKKGIILIVLAACVLLFLISQTSWFMEIKIKIYRNQLEASFARESAAYLQISQEFQSSEEPACYHFNGTSQHLTESMQDKINSLQQDCGVNIDSIYITDEGHPEYPTHACVFSATVERGGNVYAWVELVHSASPVEQLFADYQRAEKDGMITEISEDWYIMVHYGY